MSIRNTLKGKKALILMAVEKRKPLSWVEEQIQGVIDTTWEIPSPELLLLFPKGKPSPAAFIGALADEAAKE